MKCKKQGKFPESELNDSSLCSTQDVEIDVCGVLNDTTGTLMSCVWLNPNCRIGLIVGNDLSISLSLFTSLLLIISSLIFSIVKIVLTVFPMWPIQRFRINKKFLPTCCFFRFLFVEFLSYYCPFTTTLLCFTPLLDLLCYHALAQLMILQFLCVSLVFNN